MKWPPVRNVGAAASRPVFLACLFAVSLAGCAGSYNQTIDQQITAATQDGDKLIVALENTAYESQPLLGYNAKDYDNVEGQLMALSVALRNSPDSETPQTADWSDQALRIIRQLQKRHAAGQIRNDPHDTYLRDQALLFNFNMGLLTSYESLLKGGSSTGSAMQKASTKAAARPAAAPN